MNFLERAIEVAVEAVKAGNSPFGAVVVRQGGIVAAAGNCVITSNDPFGHAEMIAMRNACFALGQRSLDSCDLFTSCEPCSMCCAALYRVQIRSVYFAFTAADAAQFGFVDKTVCTRAATITGQDFLEVKHIHVAHSRALEPFELWASRRSQERASI